MNTEELTAEDPPELGLTSAEGDGARGAAGEDSASVSGAAAAGGGSPRPLPSFAIPVAVCMCCCAVLLRCLADVVALGVCIIYIYPSVGGRDVALRTPWWTRALVGKWFQEGGRARRLATGTGANAN